MRFIERKGSILLATLSEDGIIKLWLGNEIKEVIRIYDEEIKSDLGVEEIHIRPKTFTYSEGVFIVGFEQNLIIKINVD